MNRVQLTLAAVVLFAVVPSVASAQQAGSIGHYLIVQNEAGQEDLKLTEEQKEKVATLVNEARKAMEGLSGEERRKKFREVVGKFAEGLKKTLNGQQQTRLDEIELQRAGLVDGLRRRAIAKKVMLTESQREKVVVISDQLRKATRGLFRQEGGREKVQKLRQEANAKVKAMLTEEQKKQWTAVLGKPFDVSKLRFGGRRKKKD